ncbi:integrating conjugative element protein [Pseudomonas luteola]|uniref:Integrating conjugative element protein n=1 Tax=Pseudomonas luteola TaxID=47886 RepID=A0A2X2C3F6_PSELU|nr:TIGR03759 family integrating conjugative element protein [Pseudomonas luteola]SPZ02557.1 integrating conjugative element protein [Pseudomonas luteola]
MRYCLIGLSALLICSPGFAQEQVHSQQTNSQIRESDQAALDEKQAKAWGLTDQEWKRYQSLMQGPRGLYSPGLDPLTALGIEAQTEQERQHYAELQARAEAQRVQKELAYQNAYDEAAKRLAGNTLPINLPLDEPSSPKASPVTTSSKLALFVKANCPACDAKAFELQRSGQGFDIYMVGSRNDDQAIRKWALGAGIDPKKVKSQVITLNHDRGRWMSIGGQGDLPALVSKVNGQWQRQ